MTERKHCSLYRAIGRDEPCPRGACAFWEDGGAVLEPGCYVERLGLDLRRPDLGRYLLDLRLTLEEARDREEHRRAQAAYAQLVPPELTDR
jgi:hypothetical protein